MSVVGSTQIAYRRFSGWLDPRYPQGFWLGTVTVLGDASGGTLTASLIFAEATQANLNSSMFSLEELGVSSLVGADRDVRISTDNLGRDGPGAIVHRMQVEMGVIGGIGDTAMKTDTLRLPIYLGAMRIIGVQTRLICGLNNGGVGLDVRFEAQGYWWGSRSVLVDGGPQRPPTGLYGS